MFNKGDRVRVAQVVRGGAKAHVGVTGVVSGTFGPYVYVIPDKAVGPMNSNEYTYHKDYYILERENNAEELINEDWS